MEEAVVRLLVVLVVAPHAQHHVETLAVQIWSITHTPVNRDVKRSEERRVGKECRL